MTQGDSAESDTYFEALLRYLKEERGFDFTGYKRASLMRRVRRQMDAAGVADYESYLDYLQVHPEEFTALFNTILINVTGFFRDTDAWEYLREQIAPAIVSRSAGGPIRLWSAGCSSGEEAYSLAMTFADVMGVEDYRARVKIYATDIDDDALGAARQAMYYERHLKGVDPAWTDTYLERASSGVRVLRPELRRTVIFGRNDLVQDAPISRVDLLVCRNTLMYFNAETQSRILGRLHFALKPEGVLFLGKAEMLLSHGALFAPIDIKRRFFRKVEPDGARERRAFAPVEALHVSSDPSPDQLRIQAYVSSPVAQLAIDSEGKLAAYNHKATHLFGLGSGDLGQPFQDLEVSYRPVELRASIEQVKRNRLPVWVRGVEWKRPGGEQLILDVQVAPLQDGDGALLGSTVIFHDITRFRQMQAELEYANRQLETAYEELQSTNEELETTNEELQSTVEELETTNEELQSTNEELETMNEELQSMNDELQQSNDELSQRTDEVGELNQFMDGVLSGLHLGVAVVDADLRVRAWNRRASDMWGLRPDEAVGEHLLNLDIGLPVDRLRDLVRRTTSDGREGAFEQVVLSAVNRRGRSVEVKVTVSRLTAGEEHRGAIVVMEQVTP